jgi:amino acid transporter
VLSILVGWLVNRGPRTAARAFGPATLAVLLLLWMMVLFTIGKLGFHLPGLNLHAFTRPYVHFTLSGYAQILALMTGIEVFANLVAAYEGDGRQKSRKAFGSLVIILGTTCVTMLIVGPAILQLPDPTNDKVSVFTQTMNRLLPWPLPYLGTLVGVIVLGSAAAASAQGLQNLALGLCSRRYIPGPLWESRSSATWCSEPTMQPT